MTTTIPKAIGSIKTFIDVLSNITDEISDDEILFYRGHSNESYQLIPGIYRDSSEYLNIENEDSLFKELIRICPNDFRSCHSTFEKLVKMQHYDLPTRLLDISTNPLVALFFACCSNEKIDGNVFIFRVKKDHVRYYDSDAVSVVANLAKRPVSFKIPTMSSAPDSAEYIEEFNKEEDILYLLHEIKYEKPHFINAIRLSDLEKVFCVKPMLDNPRIIRQSGAFFLFGIKEEKRKVADFSFSYEKLTINGKDKDKILKNLESLGISEGSLFPEIDKVSHYLKENIKRSR